MNALTSDQAPSEAPEAEPATRTPRPPTRELLPTGVRAAATAALAAGLVIASFADFGASGWAVVGAVLCPALVLLGAIDLEHRLLPNDIVLPTAIAVALVVAIFDSGAFVGNFAAGAALGLFFFAFGAFFPGSLGMGDAKLGFVLGLALGSRTLPAMVVAFAGLLLAALYVLARRGLAARKDAIPFGPFLALGGILAFFLG